MVDPLAEVVSLLQPSAPFSKLVLASAPWAVRRSDTGRPFYFALLQGRCHLRIDGPGDLIPAARGFATSSVDRQPPREGEAVTTPITPMPGGARVGDPDKDVSARMLVGHCVFRSTDAALLVPLLPQWVHIQGDGRLSMLMHLVGDESRADRPARDMVMERLLEVLLIEAFRANAATGASPGLVQGLSDPKLAVALRSLHAHPERGWTMALLAREAALSRSAFFDRFSRAVGMAPMAYLLAWRMALAKRLLRQREGSIAEVAERVGYSSVSTFGVAFARHVGMPPGRFVRESGEVDAAS